MALQKTLVHLNINGGIDTKADDFLDPQGKLEQALNVEFDDSSTVRSRGGQIKSILPSGYATAVRMFSHRDVPHIEMESGETLRANDSTLASRLGDGTALLTQTANEFVRVGCSTGRVQTLLASGVSSDLVSFGFDIAQGNTTYAVLSMEAGIASSTGTYTLRLTIRKCADDSEIQTSFITSGGANDYLSLPRVIYDSTNDRFALFRVHSNDSSNAFTVNGSYVAASGGAVTSVGALITLPVAGRAGRAHQMDVAICQGQGYCVAMRDVTTTTVVMIRLLSLSLGGYGASTVASATVSPPASLTAHATYNGATLTGHAFYAYANTLNGVQVPSNTSTASAEVAIYTGAAANRVGRIAAADSGSNILIVADLMSSAGILWKTHIEEVSTSSSYTAAATSIDVISNCMITGRIFSMRSSLFIPMAPVLHHVTDQTVLVMNLSASAPTATTPAYYPVFSARIDPGEVNYTSDQLTKSSLTSNLHSRVPGTDYRLISYVKLETNLRLVGGQETTNSVCLAKAVLDPVGQLGDAEINGLSVLAGALPLVCDGRVMVEEGFHWAPVAQTGLTITPITTSGSLFSFPAGVTASYTVVFTIGWMDAKGNWHESAPSPEHTVAVTDVAKLSIDPVLLLPPTLKQNVYLLMYRTKGNSTDTSLYLAHNGTLPSTSTPKTSLFGPETYFTYPDDTTLGAGEQLYTAGNVLPNTPAPPCRHVSVFQKRLVLSGCGDGSEVHWSKQSTPGYGVEFSSGDPTHQTVVPRKAGRVVATQEMDDRLWVICENSIGVISGTGPDPTGTQGQYSDFSTAISEVGCLWASPKSVIRGPEGIWFQSGEGIRLASRGGGLARDQMGEVGASVDNSVSGTIVAISGAASQQIRFYQSSGTVLVWDFQFGQWSQFTGFANVDAVYSGGRHYHLSNVSTTPLLRYTSSSTYVDVNDAGTANSLFTSTVQTGWLSFAGIQGFQRIYRLMSLAKTVGGEGSQPWDIAGALYYDFVTSSGSETFSSSITPSGGLVQFQHHLARQKCETIKLQIAFTPHSASVDYALRLTDLTLQLGVKPGYYKLPSSKRI